MEMKKGGGGEDNSTQTLKPVAQSTDLSTRESKKSFLSFVTYQCQLSLYQVNILHDSTL